MLPINYESNFVQIDTNIWKRTKLDAKGRIVLPRKLRQKLGVSNGISEILWICVNQKPGKTNLFILEIGVKKDRMR